MHNLSSASRRTAEQQQQQQQNGHERGGGCSSSDPDRGSSHSGAVQVAAAVTTPGAVQHVKEIKENWHWKWKMIKRSNSEKKKRALYDRRVALEEDVAHLQTQLKTERAVRHGLERALGGQSKRVPAPPHPWEVPSSSFSPKAKELITEIASLEGEVAGLEQHVLSLYRRVLDAQISASQGQASSGGNGTPIKTPAKATATAKATAYTLPAPAAAAAALTAESETNTPAATPPPPPSQPRLFSRISLKRKSNNTLSTSHRRNGSSPGTPQNEPDEKALTSSSGSSSQTKSRHVSLLGGAFSCIDGSSAEETSQQPISSPQVQTSASPALNPSFMNIKLGGSSRESGNRSGNTSRGSSRESTRKELFAVLPRSAPLTLLAGSGSYSAPSSERGSGYGCGKLFPESPRFYAGSPNRLSEELVRCMAAIYCKLADPPLSQNSAPISPASSSSSSASSITTTTSTATNTSTTTITTTVSSPRGFACESWSPRWGLGVGNGGVVGGAATAGGAGPGGVAAGLAGRGLESSRLEATSLVDPFQLKDRKVDVVGAYHCAVEVPWICVDKDRLNYAARALRHFRLMVEQLEKVDPGLMKNDEKTAFWINVYNALMMHAYLAYGIPRSHLKRIALVQKASYKIGPHSINAHTIEHCILGCRARRPTQWLQTLFTPGPRFKAGDERRAYAIEKPEPLVCFALCCGIRSDPAIRVYSAKYVRQELELARREYLQASIGVRSGSGNAGRVFLPKVMEWYARETMVTPANLVEWVSQYATNKQQDAISQLLQSRSHRSAANAVEWLAYNSNFRYIFIRDLARIAPLVAASQ